MRYTALFLLVAIVCSCKSKEDKLKEKILPVLTKVILRDSIAVKIDSFIIWNIDTLTDLDYQNRRIDLINSTNSYFLDVAESFNKTAKVYQDMANSSLQTVKLYSSIGSSTLASLEADKGLDYTHKSIEETKKSKQYTDSVDIYSKIAEGILKNIKGKKFDSVKIIGFKPWVRLVGADKTGHEVKMDSLWIFLTRDLNLMKINIHE